MSTPALGLEPISSLERIHEEWSALARRSGNVFATWEWNERWWRHFGRGRELAAFAARDAQGQPVAVLPLYVWRRRPLRIVRLLGHGAGDELGPVCAPGDRGAAADALRRALRVTRAHVFVGEQLRGDAGWTPLLGGRVLTREGSPVTPLEGRSWNDLLAARSSNFREQVRRRERKLAREHELRYRLTADASSLAADLDVLFALHRASRAAGSSFGGRAAEAFHRDFAALALERGWLRLWTLELDGVPAAAWYGFRFEDAESYYQLGRDPAFDRLSVGFVLLSHTIRAALEDGAREYRFLRGGESYKYRFADSDPGLETIGLARGPLGAVALAAASGARAVRRALRARRARARGRAPT